MRSNLPVTPPASCSESVEACAGVEVLSERCKQAYSGACEGRETYSARSGFASGEGALALR